MLKHTLPSRDDNGQGMIGYYVALPHIYSFNVCVCNNFNTRIHTL